MNATMHGQTPEHYLEVLLTFQDRAEVETDAVRRELWCMSIRQIEAIFADHIADVAEARDRLAGRTDPQGRRMYAYVRDLTQTYAAAEREAKDAIERARRG